ncbi:flagellar basal body-associated FliL family protein [Roseomonas sp. GC11]|uniref:flagellar basal body-associated FliL family protein n=1 Tax=Roseomonas sp. GC11 TaxID=2950546 RepID=UPI002109703E|nr:flagellar basal body-associated FliL family protein [Roseomonas sp. GC11]MCQ4159954.1 flagellar basal body-associated FliL family protein [Roseomonas sp. GC11]
MSPKFRRSVMGALAAVALLPSLAAPLAPAMAAEAAPKKEFEFVTLGDFTVNLPGTNRRMSYVVVSVTLETKAEQTQQFRDLSPRLKQAVLRRLMAMSERQELRPGRLDPALLRDSLYDSLAQVQEDGLKDVVITRLILS